MMEAQAFKNESTHAATHLNVQKSEIEPEQFDDTYADQTMRQAH